MDNIWINDKYIGTLRIKYQYYDREKLGANKGTIYKIRQNK